MGHSFLYLFSVVGHKSPPDESLKIKTKQKYKEVIILRRLKSYIITKEKRKDDLMNYNELIELLEQGHEIEGETSDNKQLRLLKIDSRYLYIFIFDNKYLPNGSNDPNEIIHKIRYGKIETILADKILYNNKTFKQLLDDEDFLIYDIF